MKVLLLRLALVGILLAAWEFLTGGWIGAGKGGMDIYFSSPSKILGSLVRDRAVLVRDLTLTLTEAFSGLALGTLTGLLFGVGFAKFRLLDQVVEPILQALNSVPRPALAPLLVIWFGLGTTSKVMASWSVVFFVVFYNVYAGVKSIDPDYVKAIRLLGASSGQITRIVVVPSVVSWLFAAFRVSVAYSLLGAIVGEFAGAVGGLGYRLLVAEGLLQTDLLYAILFILMFVGFVLTEASKRLESWLLRWRPPLVSI